MSLDDIERYDDYQAKVMSANQNMSVSWMTTFLDNIHNF
jgi:hypothetical protein